MTTPETLNSKRLFKSVSHSRSLSSTSAKNHNAKLVPTVIVDNIVNHHPIYKISIDYESPHTSSTAIQIAHIAHSFIKDHCIASSKLIKISIKDISLFCPTLTAHTKVIEEKNRLIAIEEKSSPSRHLRLATSESELGISQLSSVSGIKKLEVMTFEDRFQKVKEKYDKQRKIMTVRGLEILKNDRERLEKLQKLKNKSDAHDKYFQSKSAERLRHIEENKRIRDEFASLVRQRRRGDERDRQDIYTKYTNDYSEDKKRKEHQMKEYYEELDKKWERERTETHQRRAYIERHELRMTLALENELKQKSDHHEKLLRGIKKEEKAVLEEASQQMQLKLERAKKLKDEEQSRRQLETKFEKKIVEKNQRRTHVLENLDNMRKIFGDKLRSEEVRADYRQQKVEKNLEKLKKDYQEKVEEKRAKFNKSLDLSAIEAKSIQEAKAAKILSRHRNIQDRAKELQRSKEELEDLSRMSTLQLAEERNSILGASARIVTRKCSPLKALSEFKRKTKLSDNEVEFFITFQAIPKNPKAESENTNEEERSPVLK